MYDNLHLECLFIKKKRERLCCLKRAETKQEYKEFKIQLSLCGIKIDTFKIIVYCLNKDDNFQFATNTAAPVYLTFELLKQIQSIS